MLLTFVVSLGFSAVSDYRFSYSAGTYTEITGGTVLGTAVVGGLDYSPTSLYNQMYVNVPIPFLFGFNGNLHNQVTISTYGYMMLNGTTSTTSPISSTMVADGVISILAILLQGNVWDGNLGEVRYETLGVAPNRVFIVQWKNFRRGSSTGESYNFQVHLNETSNVIKMVFGTMTVNYTGTNNPQLGLRGTSNADFINRVVTTNWATSDAGTSNYDVVRLTTTVYPASGCSYTFTPDAPTAVPALATAQYPSDTATNVYASTNLSWSDGGGWTTGFKLYFGTNYPPTNLVNGADLGIVKSYDPTSDLAPNTPHYWKIVPYNSIGENDTGPVWSFTTAGAPLSGIKTIGGGGDYTNFTQAINALNATGVGSGGVTFVVAGGSYNENPPAITASGAADKPIVFQAAVDANPVLTPAGGTGTFGFKLEGADYITFNDIDISGPGNLNYGFWLSGLSNNGSCYNTIQNCTISLTTVGSFYGIYSLGATDGANNHNVFINNVISNFGYSIYVSGSSTNGSETQNLNVQGNTLTNVSREGIHLSYVVNATVQYNNIGFMNNGSVAYYGINIDGIRSTYHIHHNTFSGGHTSFIFRGIYCAGGYGFIDSNHISNVYVTGNGTWYGFYSYGTVLEWTNNTISDVHNLSNGSTYGFYAGGIFDTWNNNTICNVTATTGTLYAAYLSLNNSRSFSNNTITDLSSAGLIYSMYIAGGLSNTVYNNKIYDVESTGSGSATVNGIFVNGGTINKIYNNMIYDIRNNSGSDAPQIRGISLAGGTANNIWNNTVFLSASGTNENFSTAGLSIAGEIPVDLKNNIFVNKSIPGSNGRAVAFWKTTSGVVNLSASSDKNIYYSGIPDASHLIGYFGAVPYQSLEDYKIMAATKDQGSYSEDVPFISSTAPYDLHISTVIPTLVESNAIAIPEVAYDFDGDPRNPVLPDIGADEGDFMPLGEAPGNVTLLTPPNSSTELDPNGLTVSWSAPATGGTPVYYRVFVAATQAGILDGYYADVNHPSTSLDLSTIAGLQLGFLNTWYWAVQAFNSIGGSDTEDSSFMVWQFSTKAQMQSATTLAFGTVWPGDTRQGNIVIQNIGSTELTFNVSGPPQFSFGTPSRYLIPANSSVNLPYTFTAPLSLGAYAEVVTLHETLPGSSTIIIDATAEISTQISFGTGTTNQFQPVYPYYGYTYAQTIYPAAWFSYPDGYRIEKLQYYWNPSLAPNNTSSFKIWMGHTNQTVFPTTVDGNSWLPVSQMTLVFDGEWNISAGSGWKEIVLQVPFVYNRTQNLVIAIDENSPGYDISGNGSASYFRGTATTERRGISAYDDDDNLDPENTNAIPPSSFTSYASRTGYPNTRFILGPVMEPPLPLPFVEDWSSASLDTNFWTADTDNWHIDNTLGNPSPAVVFQSTPDLMNYDSSLTSHEFDGTGISSVKLKFNIDYDYTDWMGSNVLILEIWNGTTWTAIGTYAYYNVTEPTTFFMDISSYAAGNNFKIRFRADGFDGSTFNYWLIDNIRLEEIPVQINTPQNLTMTKSGNFIYLNWDPVPQADWYGLYLAFEAYGPFYYGNWVDASITQLEGEITTDMDPMLFFRITAGAGDPPEFRRTEQNSLEAAIRKLKSRQ